ncbi:MAG: hypothetical protein ICV68_09965 [Pyrinomonadaceae bacterium]|nr:hypothetical protein [Pyrinomonadaceae bacterium]
MKSRWKFNALSAAIDSQRPSDERVAHATTPGGLQVSNTDENQPTLSSLPIGAHLILRCRKDWRYATVVAATLEAITLSVGSPKGRTYRVRRPPDALLSFEGEIPVLGEGSCWRAGFARYDTRW